MAFKVTVVDTLTGDSDTRIIPNNDYMIICTGTCYEDNVQAYPRAGTHVITIKGRDGILPKNSR